VFTQFIYAISAFACWKRNHNGTEEFRRSLALVRFQFFTGSRCVKQMRRQTSRYRYANLPEEQCNASLYGVGAARESERRIILLRKIATLLLALVLMLVLASGVALAADFIGTSGNDEFPPGTEGNDYFDGRAGDDLINALGGDDDIYGAKATIGSPPVRVPRRFTPVREMT
jgi:RTX calcium-binding nonapeptide repeat (4 copies)